VTDTPYGVGPLRARAKKDQHKQDEPKNKAEVLAVTWGLTQGDPAPYREAAIWWLLRSREDKRLKGVVDEWGEWHKEATGSDRDPWNGTLMAVLELERRQINGLAAIVRAYLDGEKPSAEVQREIDGISAVLGSP
jgi:hypothetical protein